MATLSLKPSFTTSHTDCIMIITRKTDAAKWGASRDLTYFSFEQHHSELNPRMSAAAAISCPSPVHIRVGFGTLRG